MNADPALELDELRARVAALEAERDRLKAEVLSLSSFNANLELAEVRRRVKALEAERDVLIHTNEALNSGLNHQAKRVDELEAERDRWRGIAETLGDRVAKLEGVAARRLDACDLRELVDAALAAQEELPSEPDPYATPPAEYIPR